MKPVNHQEMLKTIEETSSNNRDITKKTLKYVGIRQVLLYLDKVFSGGFNRMVVGIWADTGEV